MGPVLGLSLPTGEQPLPECHSVPSREEVVQGAVTEVVQVAVTKGN